MAGFPVGGCGHPMGRLGRAAVHQHVRDLFGRNARVVAAARGAIAVLVDFGGTGETGVGGGVRGAGAEPSAGSSLLRRAGAGADGASVRAIAVREGILPHRRTGRMGSPPHRRQLPPLQRRRQFIGSPRPPSRRRRAEDRSSPAGNHGTPRHRAREGRAARGAGGGSAVKGGVGSLRRGRFVGVTAVLGGAWCGAVGESGGCEA